MISFFDACKIHIEGTAYVLPSEVPELLGKGAMIVDIRNDIETMMRAFGVEEVYYLPFTELEERYSSLPVDRPLIVADAVGLNSKKAVAFLKSKGYAFTAGLAGGIADWEKDGFPMKPDRYQTLDGPCLCMTRPRSKS
ncbi:MAG TPA: rhodanese-like domain-containing protein [Bacteroidales bacterium]|nr:rhodanese-like domain-containing protein [Bacteroidales bacterium]